MGRTSSAARAAASRIGTEPWLADIAARATPLWDRRLPSGKSLTGARGAQERWRHWRDVLGSEEILSTRLANAGVDPSELDGLLDGDQQPGRLPTWAATFRSIFASGQSPTLGAGPDRAIDLNDPLPFEDLLIGAVRYARAETAARLPHAATVLCPSAAATLEHQLLGHLTFMASGALGREFYEFRFRRAPLAAFETLFSQQPKTTHIYDAFIETMQRKGLLRLFDRYPVLARLIAQAVEQWVANIAKLCNRYVADCPDLWKLLGADPQPVVGSIVGARADLSDRHLDGATVVALVLRSGHKLVYKPRSGSGELGWAAVLAWLNSRNPRFPLTAAEVLDRGSYHWSTWIPVQGCTTPDEVHGFYVRCGMTLATLHALSVTDIHCENIIASGDHPVVVDLEMLLNPGMGPDLGTLARTGMLPNWQTTPGGHRFDMSALGADSRQRPGGAIPAWLHINTDQMMRVKSTAGGPSMDHRVQFGDVWPTALDHIDALVDGFVEGYRCFLQGREALCEDPKVKAALTGIELRVLLRDTTNYARLLLYLLQPNLLRDGLDRSIEIEWLARPLSVATPYPVARLSIYDIERRAMEAQNIPHFTVSAWNAVMVAGEDEDLQALGNGRMPETLYQRLAMFSEVDLHEHLTLIGDAVRQRFRPDVSRDSTNCLSPMPPFWVAVLSLACPFLPCPERSFWAAMGEMVYAELCLGCAIPHW